MRTTRSATPPGKRCAKSGRGRPMARFATRFCPTSRHPPVRAAACAGVFEIMLAMAEPANPFAAAPASAPVVVAIPALNEEASIADVVTGIPRAVASRVIVADGGSRDATAARAAQARARVVDAGQGYGRACWTG